jgi:putative endonuclease
LSLKSIKLFLTKIVPGLKYLYVYILECFDETFYVGVTNDVGRRFIEHNKGLHETSYTYRRRPLKLVFCKKFTSPIKAINYEKQIKRWTKAKKLALINNDIDLLHDLAKCRNDTSHIYYNESG